MTVWTIVYISNCCRFRCKDVKWQGFYKNFACQFIANIYESFQLVYYMPLGDIGEIFVFNCLGSMYFDYNSIVLFLLYGKIQPGNKKLPFVWYLYDFKVLSFEISKIINLIKTQIAKTSFNTNQLIERLHYLRDHYQSLHPNYRLRLASQYQRRTYCVPCMPFGLGPC